MSTCARAAKPGRVLGISGELQATLLAATLVLLGLQVAGREAFATSFSFHLFVSLMGGVSSAIAGIPWLRLLGLDAGLWFGAWRLGFRV